MTERFRIKLSQDNEGFWEAKIYDLADHGPRVPYAGAWSSSLDVVLREATHYVSVAETDAKPLLERG